jgi:hypothetical protein
MVTMLIWAGRRHGERFAAFYRARPRDRTHSAPKTNRPENQPPGKPAAPKTNRPENQAPAL